MKKTSIKISSLKDLAIEYNSKGIPESEIIQNDLTDVFFLEIEEMLKNKELINIQITGDVTTTKSTTGSKLVKYINGLLGKRMHLGMLQPDQTMFIRKVLEGGEKRVCYLIDEFSELEMTGFNATTEDALLKHYSDVCAQDFVHRVSCSPDKIIDRNARIILEVIGKDVETKTSRFKIKYMLLGSYGCTPVTIGYVDIYVGDVLNEKWYKEYRERKFKKMALLTDKGVKSIRELEQAEIILECIESFKERARMGIEVNKGIISIKIDNIRRKRKRFMSILGMEDVVAKTSGYLQIFYGIGKLERKVKIMEEKINEETKETVREMKKVIEESWKEANELEKNLKELVKLKGEIDKI